MSGFAGFADRSAKRAGAMVEEAGRKIPRSAIEQVRPPIPPAGLEARWFRVKTLAAEYLECVTWDGESEGTDTIKVALPVHIRQSTYDGKTIDSITYTHTSDAAQREADDGSDSVSEYVIPKYVADTTVILAMRVGSTLVDGAEWQDLSSPGWGEDV